MFGILKAEDETKREKCWKKCWSYVATNIIFTKTRSAFFIRLFPQLWMGGKDDVFKGGAMLKLVCSIGCGFKWILVAFKLKSILSMSPKICLSYDATVQEKYDTTIHVVYLQQKKSFFCIAERALWLCVDCWIHFPIMPIPACRVSKKCLLWNFIML